MTESSVSTRSKHVQPESSSPVALVNSAYYAESDAQRQAARENYYLATGTPFNSINRPPGTEATNGHNSIRNRRSGTASLLS